MFTSAVPRQTFATEDPSSHSTLPTTSSGSLRSVRIQTVAVASASPAPQIEGAQSRVSFGVQNVNKANSQSIKEFFGGIKPKLVTESARLGGRDASFIKEVTQRIEQLKKTSTLDQKDVHRAEVEIKSHLETIARKRSAECALVETMQARVSKWASFKKTATNHPQFSNALGEHSTDEVKRAAYEAAIEASKTEIESIFDKLLNPETKPQNHCATRALHQGLRLLKRSLSAIGALTRFSTVRTITIGAALGAATAHALFPRTGGELFLSPQHVDLLNNDGLGLTRLGGCTVTTTQPGLIHSLINEKERITFAQCDATIPGIQGTMLLRHLITDFEPGFFLNFYSQESLPAAFHVDNEKFPVVLNGTDGQCVHLQTPAQYELLKFKEPSVACYTFSGTDIMGVALTESQLKRYQWLQAFLMIKQTIQKKENA